MSAEEKADEVGGRRKGKDCKEKAYCDYLIGLDIKNFAWILKTEKEALKELERLKVNLAKRGLEIKQAARF